MNTKEIRRITGLTQKQLANKFDVPYATLRNWDARDCMPEYMYKMMVKFIRLELQYEILGYKYIGRSESDILDVIRRDDMVCDYLQVWED